KAGIEHEFIYVDDGSRDDTFKEIEKLCERESNVKGISFSRNFGKEAAIFAGLKAAAGEAVAVLDCDMQHPPEILPEMYEKFKEGYDVVEGKKSHRGKEGAGHKLFANIFYGLMSKLMKIDMSDSSDYKLMGRNVVDTLLSLPERQTFFRALSFWVGFNSTTVLFEVKDRENGESKWSTWGLIRYAINNATSFSTAPLHLVSVAGIMTIIFSIVMMIQTLFNYINHRAVEGFTTVILLILMIGGIIMLGLGIIGIYIARIYEEVKGRPKYIIKKVTGDIHGEVCGEWKR
nr:glycosyltransferase family 2 protein [Lachnospiraceae bacterium]